jgi:predicted MFS family arabinose efflux permease
LHSYANGFLAGAAINGANAHIVPLLTDRGMSPTTATAVFGVMGLSTLVGRPLIGLLLDRVFAPYVAVAFFLAPLVGFPLLAVGAAGPDLGRGQNDPERPSAGRRKNNLSKRQI